MQFDLNKAFLNGILLDAAHMNHSSIYDDSSHPLYGNSNIFFMELNRLQNIYFDLSLIIF